MTKIKVRMNKYPKRIILSKDFSIRSCGGKFYLIDLNCNNLIFEPYELTKEQFNILKRLDGFSTFGILKKSIKNKRLFKTLISDLKKIGAIKYTTKNFIVFPKPSKKPSLYEVHFEFTKKCNFNCKHCYQERYLKSKEKDLDIEEIQILSKRLKELNVVRISLSGGEPFLSDVKKICSIFKNDGIKVDCIFTNGFAIRTEDIAWLKKESIHLFISLDGITPESHGIIRGISPKKRKYIFNRIIENITNLKKAGIVVKINTCIHKYNIQELPEMYYFLKKLKIDVWRMTIPKVVGRYEQNKNKFFVHKEELFSNLIRLISLFLKDVKKIKRGISVPLDLRIANIFKSEMLIKPMIRYSNKDSACDYQKERITIKPNGDIVPCGLLVDYVSGNIRKNNINKIWVNNKLQKIKNISIKEIKECNKCNYAYLCGGGCRVNSLEDYGDLFHKDNHACECMTILFGPVKKLLKENGFKLNIPKDIKTASLNKNVFIRGTKYYF